MLRVRVSHSVCYRALGDDMIVASPAPAQQMGCELRTVIL